MAGFKALRPVDNFYQTSMFFPMPVVLVSTLCNDGKTTCGSYSLLAPFYIAGKEYYAFMLECRNSSNTVQNLIKNKKCVLNFLPDDRKKDDPNGSYPQVISEAVQAVECTWADTLDGADADEPLPEGADHYEREKYRDSKNLRYHRHKRMIPELLPQRQTTLESVRYAAKRLQTA